MPYTYEPYHNPYVQSIAQLIQAPGYAQAEASREIGAAQARAAEASGQAWAGAAQNIGQSVAGAAQQITDPRRQLERAQLVQVQRTQQYTGIVNQLVANAMQTNPDGTRTADRAKVGALMAQANVPLDLQGQVNKQLDDMDTSVQKWKGLQTDHRADMAHSALQMIDAGADPTAAVGMAAAYAKGNGLASDEELRPILTTAANAQDAGTIKAQLVGIRALSEKYKDLSKGVPLPKETPGIYHPDTGTIQPVPLPPKPITNEVELANDAANEKSPTSAQSKIALDFVKKAKQTPSHGELKAGRVDGKGPVVFATFDPATSRTTYQGQDVTDRFVPPVDPTERLAAAQAFQIAQQGRAQRFQEQQAGRRELSEKIEQPFDTAQTSAQTLRDTVASAQAGNKIGGALQSLETAAAAIRAQGLNRINMAEIGMPASAGSAWDRVQGWLGKAESGQPVPPDVQKDMLAFAAVLEKGAYQKYENGWESTTARYGLTDEVKRPPPHAPARGTAGTVGGKPAVWDYRNHKWGWYAQ